MKRTALIVALIAPTTLAAQENRALDAHEHGKSALNIAIEGTQIAMTMSAPGADIVGFEYKAKTTEDRAKLEAAIADLSQPLALFKVPAAAGCTVMSSQAGLVQEDDHDDHDAKHDDHAHDHDDHADDHANEHDDHDDHEDHADGHEDHDDGHDDHAAHEASHSEFQAEYLLDCTDPTAIDRIEFAFFATFPNAQEVEVQMISDKGAQVFEVVRDAPVLDLSGMI